MADQEQNIPPPQQSPIDDAADNALCPSDQILPIIENNSFVDLEHFVTDHQVIVEVLRAHPVAYAMSATTTVPDIYLQQFWHTARVVMRNGVQTIVARIDNTDLEITVEDLRRILHLPSATDGGHQAFEAPVSMPTLVHDLHQLGLSEGFVNPSAFKVTLMEPLWATLFNLMNRCLSSKTRGVDKGTTTFLLLFHSIIYGRWIDFAEQIWTDIVKDITRAHKGHSTIPWLRFFQLIIRDHMDRTPAVRRRSRNPVHAPHQILRVNQRRPRAGIIPMNIPIRVLDCADQTAESVIGYRASLGLGDVGTEQPEPVVPTPPAQPVRTGPRTMGAGSRGTSGGVSGSGVLRVDVRDDLGRVVGSSVSAHLDKAGPSRTADRDSPVDTQDEPLRTRPRIHIVHSSSHPPPTSPSAQTQHTVTEETTPTVTQEPARDTTSFALAVVPLSVAQPSGDPSDGSSSSEDTESDKVPEDVLEGGEASESSSESWGDDDQYAVSPIYKASTVILDEEEEEEGDRLGSETEGEGEGLRDQEAGVEEAQHDVELVDNPKETEVEEVHSSDEEVPLSASDALLKLALDTRFRTFSIEGQEHVPIFYPQTKGFTLTSGQVQINTKAALSSISLHELQADIEKDAGSQPAQLHAPTSHSTVSQQTVVSSSHGDLAPLPSTTHLESTGVDMREQLLPLSTSLSAHGVLEPLASTFQTSSFVKTHLDAPTALSLSGSAGTDIVLTSSDVVQGSSGSPVIATSLPAMNTGRISSFTGVTSSLGNLSGPSLTFPEFVSKEFLDGALKAVFTRLERIEERDAERQRELDELRCLSKGKSVATESEPPIPSTTPAVTSLLRIAKPAATSLPTIPGYVREDEFDASLLSFSKQVYKLEETVRDKDAQIEMLQARIRELEATCHGQSQLPKRRHDDPGNSDLHEGEEHTTKRLCIDLAPSSGLHS